MTLNSEDREYLAKIGILLEEPAEKEQVLDRIRAANSAECKRRLNWDTVMNVALVLLFCGVCWVLIALAVIEWKYR